MKDVVKQLFNGELHEWDRPLLEIRNSEEMEKYNRAYEALYATLSHEQKKLFDEYFLCEGGVDVLFQERVYANGFKTGALIMLEILRFDAKTPEG